MNEHTAHGQGQKRTEIGIDGKPFEVWETTPHADHDGTAIEPGAWNRPRVADAPTDWVGGSYYPRGPAETAMLETPRTSMEFNNYAWFSIGLAVAAVIGLAVYWVTGSGGALPYATFAMGAAGSYYGLRAHNAGLRGFCTNGGMGLVGMVLSALTALGTIVLVFVMLAAATAEVSAG